LTIARACSVHAPNTLSIPIAANGRMVFKLDRLAPQNGFAHENAHDAMADVEATIHVAKIIKSKAPDVWGQMLGTSSKRGAASFLASDALISQTEFYAGLGHSWLVTKCGQDPTYDGSAATFDLSVDPTPYLEMSVDQLVSVLKASHRSGCSRTPHCRWTGARSGRCWASFDLVKRSQPRSRGETRALYCSRA
jgi:exodeoxyribonuclease I